MAQLKSTVVQGSLRVTDSIYTNELQTRIIQAPTNSNGTAYGVGTNGQVLKSNGTHVYWAAESGAVTGVKGSSESNYRSGNVSISADNIGLGNAKIFYGVCDTAAGTTEKKVNCTDFTNENLSNGAIILVTFDYTNTGAVGSLTLNVNNTGAKVLKKHYNASAPSNLTSAGELQTGNTYLFAYNASYNSNAGAWVLMTADYNSTYSYDWTTGAGGDGRTAETAENGGVGIHRYSLQMMTPTLTWSSLASDHPTAATTNGKATNKTVATCNFYIGSPIIYQDTNANAAPGNTVNVNGYITGSFNLQYSTTQAQWSALNIQKPVYLVGILQTGSTFKLDSTKWWTQNLPEEDDNKIYIFLGLAYSATNVYLHDYHPAFYYKDGAIRIYSSATKAMIGLGEVENTKLSTWQGTNNIKTVGTITSGTWQGTILGVGYGGTGITTATYKNAIIAGNASTATDAFQAIRTNNGAFYATAQDGAPSFGTLPIAQGGTGLTSNPSMLINLASTSAANILSASPRPGVTGTLGIGNGGTNADTAAEAWTNLGGGDSGKHAENYYALAGHTHAGYVEAKPYTITIPANVTSYTVIDSNSWITADCACIATDLQAKDPKAIITWSFTNNHEINFTMSAAGSITFNMWIAKIIT